MVNDELKSKHTNEDLLLNPGVYNWSNLAESGTTEAT